MKEAREEEEEAQITKIDLSEFIEALSRAITRRNFYKT